MMHGSFPPGPTAQPAQPSMFDATNNYAQNITPSQTTRSGRISRPPVAAPMQDQLSMLQQILAAPNATNPQQPAHQAGPSRQQHPGVHINQQALPHSAGQTSTARTNGIKRPHSALKDISYPPQPRAQPERLREVTPLVRPVPDYNGGRPRKTDPTSTEERLELRRIKNSQSGQSSYNCVSVE